MKKILFLLTGLLFMLASCSDGGSDSPDSPTPNPTPEETASITIDSNIVTNGVAFEAKGGEKTVSFSSNKDWTLNIATPVNGTAWCTVSATSGAKGDATVKFTVKENAEYDDRSVSVTIKAGTASKTFTITQKCAEALLVTSTKFEVSQEGGTIEVEVKANINYELQIAEAAKGWISESKSRALTAKKHAFIVAANEEYEKREGEIYIKSGDKVETVKVYQAGGAIILLSQNEFVVSDAGETISVDVKSNVEYGVQMPDVDWITDEASSRGMSSHTLKYVIAPNEGYDSRSAEIIFYDKNSDLKDTLKVVQAQKDAIVISEKNISVAKEGGTVEVKVNTNVDFEVQIPSDVTWISQTDSRALTERSVYLKVAENTGESSRSANITITNQNSQLSETITIAQQGNISVVSLKEAGTMKKLLGDDYLNITSLKVVGPINGDDVYYLRRMLGGSDFGKTYWGKLTTLEMSEATIVEGGEWYYEYSSSKQYYTSNNEISDYMFYKCANLENIVLPNSVTSIGSSAFLNCDALTIVEIGNSVTSIGSYAFYGCDALTTIKIPDSVTTIGGFAFEDCGALTTIKIPDSVTWISNQTFRDCDALTTVEIGNGVTFIGESAFLNCGALTTIKIPDSVTMISEYAFQDCDALTTIKIPDSVTRIGEKAFYSCDALTTVELGNGVASIGTLVFGYCSIKECYCYASTPPSLSSSFPYGVKEGATLYVPAGCVAAYRTSSWRNYFTNIIEMD